jgi:hypothetical protein
MEPHYYPLEYLHLVVDHRLSVSMSAGLRSSLRKVSTGSFNSIKDALARRQRTVLNISSHCCEERCPGAAGL